MTEDDYLKLLFHIRWGNLAMCPKCHRAPAKFHKITGRASFACSYCGWQLHPKANTIFDSSTTPLAKWFAAMPMAKTATVKQVQQQIGVTYKAAWRIRKLLREMLQ